MGARKRVNCSIVFDRELLWSITTWRYRNTYKISHHQWLAIPCSSLNPFIGTLEVPVTNCKSLARVSLSNVSTAYSEDIPNEVMQSMHRIVCVYVYVCVCVHACECMCLCRWRVHACVRAVSGIWVWVCVSVYFCVYVLWYSYTSVCVVCMHVFMCSVYAWACVCAWIC